MLNLDYLFLLFFPSIRLCNLFSKSQGLLAHPLFHCAVRRDCDGDETGFFLLLDGLINFSKKYLPETRGSTMDAPLVLSSSINPAEVDDMVFDMDTVFKYPLEFYNACLEYKMPWEVKIECVKKRLGKPELLMSEEKARLLRYKASRARI